MAYLAREAAVDRRGDLAATMGTVRSVVVIGHEYFVPDKGGVPEDPSLGVIARYARGRDYHAVVRKKLILLARRARGGGRGTGGGQGLRRYRTHPGT